MTLTTDTAPADGLALYRSLAQLTADDDTRGYPLLALCAAMMLGVQGVDDLAQDTPDRPGWAVLMDPATAPAAALPWLGQFVGVRVDPSTPEADQRAAIASEEGFGRGTPAAIIATAERYLSPGQIARLVERDQNDPYLLTVQVLGPQVVGTSYGDLSNEYSTYAQLSAAFSTYGGYQSGTDELLAALQAVKPAGLVLTLAVVTGSYYSDLIAGPYGSSYTVADAHYATYQDMINALPGQ